MLVSRAVVSVGACLSTRLRTSSQCDHKEVHTLSLESGDGYMPGGILCQTLAVHIAVQLPLKKTLLLAMD